MNNMFIDLNFLNTTYIDFLKNLSFYVFIMFMICIVLVLIMEGFKQYKKLKDILYPFVVFILFIDILAFCILFLAFTMFPACYLSALIKDILIAKYLYDPVLLTSSREIFINIISILIGVGVYSIILGKIFKKFIDLNTEDDYVES